MKNAFRKTHVILAVLALALLASSCSDSGNAFTAEFTGCNFSGANVARVEMFESGSLVAYGSGALSGGSASFTMHDADTGATWFPTLGVTYTAYAYCFAGTVGGDVPASDFWRAYASAYTQYAESAYAEIGFEYDNFSFID